MKEVWLEIKEGIGLKTILTTLLSIALLLSIWCIFFVINLREQVQTEKRFPVFYPINQTTQTNFTQ